MITIKDSVARQKMVKTGAMLAQMFEHLPRIIKAGMTTLELDRWIDQYQKEHNLTSCSKGYLGYRHASCISVNDEVVHGVPSQYIIASGDLVKVDVCVSHNGYCADMARCFFVDTIDPEGQKLIDVAQNSLDKGIAQAVSGKRISDISAAIQSEVQLHGYGIVREFAGHGIGKKMHEDPEILNYGRPGCGQVIKPGMAFAIEPMITMRDHRVYITKDGWTVKTVDKGLAAHVEDTVIVTEDGPLVITRL